MRMYDYVCKHCNSDFRSERPSRKYCSRSCRGSASNAKRYGTWTVKEDAFLVKHYAKCKRIEWLAKRMGVGQEVLNRRAKQLGLVRSRQALSAEYARGGKKNKGRPRPDLILNAFRGVGRDNPFYGKTHSDETREIISKKAKAAGTFKKLAADPEFQRKRMLGLHAKPNKPEQIIMELLKKMFPGKYRYTGSGDFVIDGLIPDFVNANGQKKIIEVFGETYHDPARSVRPVPYKSTEVGRRKTLSRFGYSLLVIWTQEIYRGGKEGRRQLRAKLKEFHENRSH